MSRNIEHRQLDPDSRQGEPVALSERLSAAGNLLASGPENGDAPALEQAAVASDVIAVMMRIDDSAKLDALALQIFDYRRCIARVDHCGLVAVAHDPDVVVGKGGDGDNCRHGGIFGRGKRTVNRHAGGVVRDAARDVLAIARAGVFRPYAGRYLRLPGIADRA